ncbi:hypothetical protein [Rhizobium leguminosarum]|uniref:hypothetical protein n=1 Tax=Rhizobium leguminosarum TaxID=384 RepID=UPI00103E7BA4|nr:hypothetical protein [Rhizobium leguminosarum]TBY41599.1 hypothetical protein E0H54_30890 [Rhizobium leguminosarum bv. viciae]
MDSDSSFSGLKLEDCEPSDWYVAFDPWSDRRWIRWLALGRFKHVSCFGFVERAQTWAFFDFHLDRSRIFVVGDHEADKLIGHYSTGKTVVRMAKPIGRELDVNISFGGWCVPAVAHIIGIRTSALRPDALFRQCLANGGEIIRPEEHENEATQAEGRS